MGDPVATEPRPTVYVVDDDASVRKSVGRLSRTAGYEVEAFASADDLLAHPPASEPGCLLLDLRMPGRDGLELQEALAAARKRIPIIFVSGHGDVTSSVRAMKGGAVDFSHQAVFRRGSAGGGRARDGQGETGWREEAQLVELEGRARSLTPRGGTCSAWWCGGS